MFVTDREPLINRSILILPLNLLNWDPTSPLSSSISSISVHVHQLSIWWCPTHYWCLEPHISPQSPTAPTPGKGETELNWKQPAVRSKLSSSITSQFLQVFSAEVTLGTSIIYTWVIDDLAIFSYTGQTHTVIFKRAATYRLKVSFVFLLVIL